MIGAEAPAHFEAAVARAGEDHRLRPQGFGDSDPHQPDWARPYDDDAFSGNHAAHDVEPIHRGAGGDDERRLGVAHSVRNVRQRVDAADHIFGEAAIGAETIRAMSFRAIAVIQARGVHALAAALAAATAGVNFHGDALAELKFVDGRAELHDGAHIFMAGREAAIERQPAIDHRRYTVADDLDIGRAYRDRVDAHENLGRPRFRNRLFNDRQLLRAAQDPSLHPIRNGVLVTARARR